MNYDPVYLNIECTFSFAFVVFLGDLRDLFVSFNLLIIFITFYLQVDNITYGFVSNQKVLIIKQIF